MKTFAIVTRFDDLSKKLGKRARTLLEGKMIYDEENPDLVLSIGGDGTMLGAVRKYMMNDPYFVGIHTGTLGFFTDYNSNELDELVESILTEEPISCPRSLLEIKVNYIDHTDVYYSLNEMRLDHGYRTQVMDIYIGNELLENFRGNGVCVSTPAGSTAYNKSIGGAVVYSNIPLMQLTEVASISNNVYRSLNSSLILDASKTISIKGFNHTHVYMATDNESYKLENVVSIDVKIADKVAKFISYKQSSYINRIRKAFISELDN